MEVKGVSLNIGFIGVGNIAEPVIERIASNEGFGGRIYLSPRSINRSDMLSKKYKNIVQLDSNQEVADSSDILIVSVLPSQARGVIESLKFRKNHIIVSLVSDTAVENIRKWTGDVYSVARIVPLPFVRNGTGPVVVFAENREEMSVFNCLGELFFVENERDLKIMLTFTALMGGYNDLMFEIIYWGISKGLDKKETTKYVSSLFEALSGDIVNITGNEVMTSGGLNEMTLDYLKNKNINKHFLSALNNVGNRLEID
jgi:pyrroline-5-carboxylate reductase